MSEPHHYRTRRSGSRNREFGSTGSFHFYGRVTINGLVVQGLADGDLFGYSEGPPVAHSPGNYSSNEGVHVRDNGSSPNTGRSTHNAAASRAGNHSPRASFHSAVPEPSIVLDRRSDHGSQSSIRSTTGSSSSSERLSRIGKSYTRVQTPLLRHLKSLVDLNYMDPIFSTASGLAEGSTTLVNTPIEDLNPISVVGLAIGPISQKLDQDPMDKPISDSDADSIDISSSASFQTAECGGCEECHGSAGAAILTTLIRGVEDPTDGELAVPSKTDHDAEQAEQPVAIGFIDRVEQFFRSLPNRVKGSSLGRFLNLGRQVAPPI